LSHGLKPGQHLREAALADKEVSALLSEKEVRSVFAGDKHRAAIRGALERAGVLKRKRKRGNPRPRSGVKIKS